MTCFGKDIIQNKYFLSLQRELFPLITCLKMMISFDGIFRNENGMLYLKYR